MSENLYAEEKDGIVRIGNAALELAFDGARKGALVSLLDKRTGYQFLRDPRPPRTLFRLAIRDAETRGITWLDARDARTVRFDSTNRPEAGKPDRICLAVEVSGFPDRDLAVRIEVSVLEGSPLSLWRMSAEGLAANEAVYQLMCPVISGVMKVGDHVAGECVAAARQGEGYVFRNPFPVVDGLPLRTGVGPDTPRVGMGEIHGLYPGSYPIQLLLYYNDIAGLYLASHDAAQNVKSFDLGQVADWGMFPILSISHFPSETPGKGAAFEYDTVVGVFHGDWYDGADIYKAWARKQWWCAKKLWERDIAEWMRTGVGVFQLSNYHLPVLKLNHPMSVIADTVNQLSREAGVPILALVFNFEGGGGWTGPIGFFPPREGEEAFAAAMKKLRDAGNYGFIYMPGGNWYIAISSYDPPFDSWPQFEAAGRPNAVMAADRKVHIASWYKGWQGARICPHTKCCEELTASLLLGALERGCTVVQIDNFPCCGADACYDATHGHPLGYGPWWSEDWNRILAETRRQAKALDPDCAITTEGISENFIPYLDMFDERAGNMEYFGHWGLGDPMGGELIPLFTYIYSGYIGAYLAAYPECNRPEILYWTRSLGKSLARGVVPTGGRYYPEPKDHNPVTIAFYKKVVRAAARECWKYFMFGEMLRPPKIDVPMISASYLKMHPDLDRMDPDNRHVVRDYAVQHSAWRAMDGTIGYFFINISQEPVEFDVVISSYGRDDRLYDVDTIVDGSRSPLLRKATLPSLEHFRTEPLSVTVVEVREAGS